MLKVFTWDLTFDHLPLLLVLDASKRDFSKAFSFKCFRTQYSDFLHVGNAWASHAFGFPSYQFFS